MEAQEREGRGPPVPGEPPARVAVEPVVRPVRVAVEPVVRPARVAREVK